MSLGCTHTAVDRNYLCVVSLLTVYGLCLLNVINF